MLEPQRLRQIGDKLAQRIIDQSHFTTLFDLRYIFPIVTLEELKSLNKEKKISFLFKADDLTLRKFSDKKTNSSVKLATSLLGIFVIVASIFCIYYSIQYSEYLVLLTLPLIFIALAFSSPYKRTQNWSLYISLAILLGVFFIGNGKFIVMLIAPALTNICSYLVRKFIQTKMTKVILSDELAFVQGYVNNSFSLRNEKNKAILLNVAPENLQQQLLRDFEDGLTI